MAGDLTRILNLLPHDLQELLEHRLSIDETAAILRVSRVTLWRYRDPDQAPEHISLEPGWVGSRAYYTPRQLGEWKRQVDQRRERKRAGAYGKRRAV